jgi:hypothetical protein
MIGGLRFGSSVAILAAACTSAEPPPSTAVPDKVPEPVVHIAEPEPMAPRPDALPRIGAPEHRLRGDIAGGFVVGRQEVRVAEPVVLAFEVHSTDGPMTVFLGGDQRNAAYFPTRVGVKVQRVDDSTVVCDSVAAPAIPSFGGPGGDHTLQQGELLRESFVLNPMCPALADPGTYRVTLHRRITSMAMVIDVKGVPTSCDVSPVHEDAPLRGLPDGCAEIMRAVPSVTTTFELEVLPYDRAEAETAIADAYARADAASPKDEILKNRLDAWLRGWVKCDGASLPEVAPPTLAVGCAKRTVR